MCDEDIIRVARNKNYENTKSRSKKENRAW